MCAHCLRTGVLNVLMRKTLILSQIIYILVIMRVLGGFCSYSNLIFYVLTWVHKYKDTNAYLVVNIIHVLYDKTSRFSYLIGDVSNSNSHSLLSVFLVFKFTLENFILHVNTNYNSSFLVLDFCIIWNMFCFTQKIILLHHIKFLMFVLPMIILADFAIAKPYRHTRFYIYKNDFYYEFKSTNIS